MWANGELVENFEYNLKDTPCEIVWRGKSCYYPNNIQKLFPKDKLLVEMGIESYLGVPLHDNEKKSGGLLVVMHNKNDLYPNVYPVKLFEYMAAGIPVVAADYPRWRRIVDDAQCGLLVDPADPKQIGQAIQYLLEHPQEAQSMGRRGQAAARQHYCWSSQAQNLLNIYSELT